jgi:hypothetical protein
MSRYAGVPIALATLLACESARDTRSRTATQEPHSADTAVAAVVDSVVPTGLHIGYQVVQEWTIGPNGYGRVIVIDPRHRNEADLRRLGAQLNREASRADMVSIEVYDDIGAARMRDAAVTEDLPKHDRHRIGVYDKNQRTGSNEWSMAPKGMQGNDWEAITVKY